jgi:hypothetical protein
VAEAYSRNLACEGGSYCVHAEVIEKGGIALRHFHCEIAEACSSDGGIYLQDSTKRHRLRCT